MVPRPSQGADKLTFNFLRMFVRQISFLFACRYLGPSRTPVPTILFCRNCLSIYQFVVCIVCRWAGAASNSPTDKPLIRAVELSFYQAVAFAAGGASPSPTVTYAVSGCLCIKLSSASRADRRTTNCRPYGVAGSFRFACRFRQASPSQLAVKGRGTTKWWKGCTSARELNFIVLCPVK